MEERERKVSTNEVMLEGLMKASMGVNIWDSKRKLQGQVGSEPFLKEKARTGRMVHKESPSESEFPYTR